MGLIAERLNNRLNEIIGKCFEVNRLCDRGQSILSVTFKMPKTAKVVHMKCAHPIIGSDFADSIGDYQESRDNTTVYPATPVGNTEYAKPIDFFYQYQHYLLELESLVKDVVDDAIEIGDTTTKVFLDGFLSRLIPVIANSITFIDLFTQYGNDSFHLSVLDSIIDDYIK